MHATSRSPLARSRLALPAAALILALGLAGCETVQTTQPGAVGVTRTQRMAVSSEEIQAASAQAYRDLLQEAASEGVLDRDAAQVARVRDVTARLVPATSAFRPEALGWTWEAHLFDTNEINAFCMAGGKIGVYSGLLDRLQLTDAELAAVIGHEMAHALREHVREQVSLQQAQELPLAILSAVTGNEGLAQLGDMVADVTLSLPRSRQAELEADRIGVELAARAGFDPTAAVSLWRKMRSAGGGAPPEFLSTHPSAADREAQLVQAAQVVMPLYRQAVARR
ncbi:M48 family metallopeptidase [Ramlibacter sp.]|uniref:M48 family metallopeptidase n=1 Tax=Ramlibacter sp. TaxID=1917967 RepID=UPI002D68A891|nr:M48 family metallopeptidase [Ramlibacter sp.]HYD76015.1 M48 family metallopeptidase [Ramlibacter sp.]